MNSCIDDYEGAERARDKLLQALKTPILILPDTIFVLQSLHELDVEIVKLSTTNAEGVKKR